MATPAPLTRFVFTNAQGAVRRINMELFKPTRAPTGRWHRMLFVCLFVAVVVIDVC